MLILYLIVALFPFESHYLLGMSVYGQITPIKIIGFSALLYALIYRMAMGSKTSILDSPIAKFFLLFCMITYSSMLIFSRADVLHRWSSYISFITLLVLTTTFLTSKERFRRFLWVVVLSMAFGSLATIKEYFAVGQFFGGGYISTNYFALACLPCLGIAYGLLLGEERRFYKIILILATLIIIIGLSLATSRAGWLGFVAGLLMLLKSSKRKVKALIGVSAAVLLLMVFMPGEFWENVGLFGYEESTSTIGSNEGHKALAWACLKIFTENPLLGIGADNLPKTLWRYLPEGIEASEAHSVYLEIMSEQGLVGITVFLAIVFSTFRTLKKVRSVADRIGDKHLMNWTTGLGVGLVGFLAGGAFHSVQLNKFFWLTVFLIVVLGSLLEDKGRSATPAITRQRLLFLRHRNARLVPVYRRSL